ncbi:RNA polymerase II elongation factor ELL3 [Grus americana]|uniref:RNA polymerase II elongation factor ELL3 n=1 Tax=Grus americana TaxID=9117 RepID=UPI0024085646|nr:RNA polymerase II elongation factor ELL3 [Grus americana]
MPRPRAELRGRLRYRGCGPSPRLSLLHVRLSAAAARALRGCGRRQGAPGPVIAFQGSQGCLTVPGGPGTPPQLFAFSLSRCSQDEPHSSFECVRLAVPRLGQGRLDSLGSIQQKITVCAWESSCPPLWERVSPAKEPHSRAVVEPDLAVLGYGKGITAPEKASMTGLLGKGSACHVPESRNHRPAAASPRASVQSLVQPHCKHELLQRLGGMPAGRPSGTQLLAAPEEVMDPAACSYHVRGTLVGRSQEDCTGYTAQEWQQAALLQCRNQDRRPSAPTFLVPLQQPLEHGSPQATGRNLLGVKRLALLDFSDPRASKRPQAPVSSPGSQKWHRSCPQTLSMRHPGARGQQQAGSLPPSSHAGELESPESKEEAGDDWEESAPCPEQHLPAPRDVRSQAGSSSLADIPDYLRKYHTICSVEQRRAYEAAFSADYTEYRDLHARIGNVRRKFIQLGAKMKMLKEGTEERKALEARIVHEYSHFKKTYPSYQQEKNRCEYLHQKLSHIKILILQYEGSGSS